MKIDLHTHSTLSDGVFTPEEIVDMACAVDLRVLAITDHDSIASFDRARAAAAGRKIAILPGVEISAAIDGTEVHVLGYFRSGVPQALKDFLGDATRRRETRMQTAVDNLRLRGLPIDLADVRAIAGPAGLSRAHLAQLLVARGIASSIEEAFENWLGYHTGLIPPMLTPVSDALKLIADCDGVSVWAHPPSDLLESKLKQLVSWGLRGLETYRRKTKGVRTSRLVELGDSLGLYATAGSDWHGFGREPLGDDLSFPPARLKPFLEEFGIGNLAA